MSDADSRKRTKQRASDVPMLQRVLRPYERIEHRIRVRWPFFAVLQPLPVLGYVIIAWVFAAILAWALRGTAQRPLDPEPYQVVWLGLSLLVALIWMVVQWRERSTLPRPIRMPLSWSFAPTFAILVLIFSPSWAWERFSYRETRNLLTEDETLLLYAVFFYKENVVRSDPVREKMEHAVGEHLDPAFELTSFGKSPDTTYGSRICQLSSDQKYVERLASFLPDEVNEKILQNSTCDSTEVQTALNNSDVPFV